MKELRSRRHGLPLPVPPSSPKDARRIGPKLVRRLALSLPGVEESRRADALSYRVGERAFAWHGPPQRLFLLRLSAHEQDVLTRVRPAEFALAPGRPRGWTRIDLARVDGWLLEELVVAAWRRVAAKRQAAAWDRARAAATFPRSRSARQRR
jgi:hypothetical protein